MTTEWHITWKVKRWRITLGFSLVAIGVSLLFHVWGDFGGHIVIGPLALIIEGPGVPQIGYVEKGE